MKLKDLASSLGLSQTTVSRALNGYPEVSEATRRRVLEAAEHYHYRPNPSARRPRVTAVRMAARKSSGRVESDSRRRVQAEVVVMSTSRTSAWRS